MRGGDENDALCVEVEGAGGSGNSNGKGQGIGNGSGNALLRGLPQRQLLTQWESHGTNNAGGGGQGVCRRHVLQQRHAGYGRGQNATDAGLADVQGKEVGQPTAATKHKGKRARSQGATHTAT